MKLYGVSNEENEARNEENKTIEIIYLNKINNLT